MVYYNPHINGSYNPLYALNKQGFFIAQVALSIIPFLKPLEMDTIGLLKELAKNLSVSHKLTDGKQNTEIHIVLVHNLSLVFPMGPVICIHFQFWNLNS